MKTKFARVVADLKIMHPGVIIQYRWLAVDIIHLDVLSVPKQLRNTGVGSAVMRTLTTHANDAGMQIALVPDDCLGSDPWRLRQFYTRFGFKHVKEGMLLR